MPHTIGLTCDSTCVALGWNKHEQCDVNDWHNIVAVAAGWRRIGLKSDGTVVAVGRNKEEASKKLAAGSSSQRVTAWQM